MTELENLLVLNAIPGLGNAHIGQLLERFGSAKKVLASAKEELMNRGGLSARLAENVARFDRDTHLKKECELIKQHVVDIISLADERYPALLKEIPDCPVLIYLKGALKRIDQPAIAVVGCRRASVYGVSIAEKLALGLAELGITIVSGMARGIDTASHRGALRA